jgi:hypothetical protein
MQLVRRHPLADVDDAIEALEYWRARRERLAWRRRSARREADRMVDTWERELRRTALLARGLPPARRLEAGARVVRSRATVVRRRWRRRASVATLATAGAVGAGAAAAASHL